MNSKRFGRSGRGPKLRFYLGIRLERVTENMLSLIVIGVWVEIENKVGMLTIRQ
jgi:hypothetical protein